MGLEWSQIRAQVTHLLAEAQRAGLTQKEIADRGGLPHQSGISKLKNPDSKDGPQVMTLVKAIEGMGIRLTDFFAALEGPPSTTRLSSPPQLAVITTNPDAEVDRVVGRSFRKALRQALDADRPAKLHPRKTSSKR